MIIAGLPDGIAKNTARIGELLAAKMPHLEFAIWDLSDFMPAFHNVRRTMVFIECEELARPEVINTLAGNDPRNYLVYTGERKPKAMNEAWASAKSTGEIRDAIIVVARKDFKETEKWKVNIHVPWIERRLVDLMAYSVRGWLPISIEEAVDALTWHLKKGSVRITVLQRYATRRYLGWFLDIILYKLDKKGEAKIGNLDPRYLEAGERFLAAIGRVDNE